MKPEYASAIADICQRLFDSRVEVELTRPEEQFGDFASNVAMQLAGRLAKSPKEIAEQIIGELNKQKIEASIAGPGFINLKVADKDLFAEAKTADALDRPLKNKTIVAEYSDPNPFKALHAGHLYTTLVGDATANILEASGAIVHRVNFGGDVGLHAAKALWGILEELGGEKPEKLEQIADDKRDSWVSRCYTLGHLAYEDGGKTKLEVKELNKQIYQIHANKDKTSPLAQIYWTCRDWSYEGFNHLYKKLAVKPFEKYYPESDTIDIGLEKVQENINKVYKESDGAVVFKGDEFGLFTQVFISSEGLPTYAGKDVGLIFLKHRDFKPDISYIITDAAQKEHLKVVMKSIEQFAPELVKNTVHQTHGRINLPGGRKMSSRTGEVVMADDVLNAAKAKAKDDQEEIILGAVRYSFLKNKIGGDIVYDPSESVSHEGNSGPYLQYALVRARSILSKLNSSQTKINEPLDLDEYERSLARQLSIYPEAFESALNDYSPHHICNYLFELAQVFNRFYENGRVAGDKREAIRTELVTSYEKILSHGMKILGMPTPERM